MWGMPWRCPPRRRRNRVRQAATHEAATASWSARSLSALWACSAPVSWPRTQCQRTSAWRAISSSSARTRSWFLTGAPAAVTQPLRFQPKIQRVIESSTSREWVTMQAWLPSARLRSPSSAARYSMRLFVVCCSPPESSTSAAPPGRATIAAHPPGPGLPQHAPSVHTRTSSGRAATGTSMAAAMPGLLADGLGLAQIGQREVDVLAERAQDANAQGRVAAQRLAAATARQAQGDDLAVHVDVVGLHVAQALEVLGGGVQ